jgi:2-amino-4-hydroxy-6-hydroxymethyldihydropteridine diphosphokinase
MNKRLRHPDGPHLGPPVGSVSPVFIGLGANIGSRRRAIERALTHIETHPRLELEHRTGLMETPPWGVTDQPAFLNAVARVTTDLAPLDLLDALKQIERDLGRRPDGPRWGPREIDLDILLYGDRVFESRRLTIPHPQIKKRLFVIEQLLELNPGLFDPETALPFSQFI